MEQETSINYMKKQYRLMKLIAVMVGGIFLTTALSAAVLVPKASNALEQADDVLGDLAEVTRGLREADLPGLVSDMDGLVSESGKGIQEALEKLNSVDIDKLNEAIGDLQAIVEPLARFFGR